MATDSPQRSPANPDTLVVHAEAAPARGLVPRLLAGDLGRRPPRAGGVHLRRRPEPGAGAAVRDPAHREERDHDRARRREVGDVPDRDGLDRPARDAARDRAARSSRRVEGASLRAVTVAFAVTSTAALVLVPVFLEESTAVDSLHGFFDVGALVPALADDRVRARASSTSSSVFALFVAAAWIAIWVDRPDREHALDRRDPGRDRRRRRGGRGRPHPRQPPAMRPRPRRAGSPSRSTGSTSPPARSGSAGSPASFSCGRRCPHARRVAGLAVVVPRFSNVALVSVAVLLGSGIWAVGAAQLPILSALWTTSYGQTILVKACAPRSRDGVRRRQLRRQPAAARRGARQARGRAARRLAPRRGSSRSRC